MAILPLKRVNCVIGYGSRFIKQDNEVDSRTRIYDVLVVVNNLELFHIENNTANHDMYTCSYWVAVWL